MLFKRGKKDDFIIRKNLYLINLINSSHELEEKIFCYVAFCSRVSMKNSSLFCPSISCSHLFFSVYLFKHSSFYVFVKLVLMNCINDINEV